MWSVRQGLVTLLFLLAIVPAAEAGVCDGIGVIGDSYSDEYQFYAVDRSTARNWVEILAETRGLNFGTFSAESRGEPRNQGYAFNWARSDATTEDVIASGQHTGLAAQAARGEVTLACVFTGGNDFIVALKSPDPLAALRSAAPRAVRNYRTIVGSILAASSGVKCVLATLPDIRDLPEFAEPIRDGRLAREVADAYSAAIDEFNVNVRSIARREPRIAIVDFAMVAKVANRIGPGALMIAGQRIDRASPGNSPGHLFLADKRHLGTLGQGTFARCFVATINLRFRAGVAQLTDREILECARFSPAGGIVPGLTGLVNGSIQPVFTSERVRPPERPQ